MQAGLVALTVLAAAACPISTAISDDDHPDPPLEKATSTDAAVIRATLRHFATRDESGCFGAAKRTAILVYPESAGPSYIYLSDAQLLRDTDQERWEVPSWLRKGLRWRNGAKQLSLHGLDLGPAARHWDHEKLKGWDRRWSPPEGYPDVRAMAVLWLPAYSADGRTAVVRFSFGPTPHGATATYLLARGVGGWRVTRWAFAYYV
jgi:hypothetical protein